MYAIVKTGGKQYRVEEGQSLLVERLREDDGAKIALLPLLFVDGENVVDGDGLSRVKVEARVVGHERGPKLRVVKFKPKRGYKRRTGHRQELTRLEVTSLKLASGRASAKAEPKPVAADPKASAAKAKPEGAKAKPEGASAKAGGAAAKAEGAPAKAGGAAAKAEGGAATKAAGGKAEGEKPAARKAPARKPPARKPRTTKPKTEEGNGA